MLRLWCGWYKTRWYEFFCVFIIFTSSLSFTIHPGFTGRAMVMGMVSKEGLKWSGLKKMITENKNESPHHFHMFSNKHKTHTTSLAHVQQSIRRHCNTTAIIIRNLYHYIQRTSKWPGQLYNICLIPSGKLMKEIKQIKLNNHRICSQVPPHRLFFSTTAIPFLSPASIVWIIQNLDRRKTLQRLPPQREVQ